jgi:hypothetical protein
LVVDTVSEEGSGRGGRIGQARWRRRWLGVCATVVAELARVARRRSGDGRGRARRGTPQRHAGPRRSAGQAAAGSLSLVAHSAANTAGAFIPSDECGRRQL